MFSKLFLGLALLLATSSLVYSVDSHASERLVVRGEATASSRAKAKSKAQWNALVTLAREYRKATGRGSFDPGTQAVCRKVSVNASAAASRSFKAVYECYTLVDRRPQYNRELFLYCEYEDLGGELSKRMVQISVMEGDMSLVAPPAHVVLRAKKNASDRWIKQSAFDTRLSASRFEQGRFDRRGLVSPAPTLFAVDIGGRDFVKLETSSPGDDFKSKGKVSVQFSDHKLDEVDASCAWASGEIDPRPSVSGSN